MPLLRSSRALASFARCAAPLSIRQPFAVRHISSAPPRFAQGYGDGNGNPNGENPRDQGSSNAAKHNAEHPGPPPPSVGQGKGVGPTKDGSGSSPEDASAQSGGARSKEAEETGSSPTGGAVGQGGGQNSSSEEKAKSKDGNAPKIQSRSEPGGGNDQSKQAEVEQHNREFEQGHDRAPKSPSEDKVDKKFWEESGGPDEKSDPK